MKGTGGGGGSRMPLKGVFQPGTFEKSTFLFSSRAFEKYVPARFD